MPPDMVRYVARSGDHGDCVVAAVSMATGKTYEETVVACTLEAPQVLQEGMETKAILRVLKDLGFQASVLRLPKGKRANAEAVDALEDAEITGILCVSDGREHHAVYVWAGRPIEPRKDHQGMWLDISTFLESEGWKATEFITLREEE